MNLLDVETIDPIVIKKFIFCSEKLHPIRPPSIITDVTPYKDAPKIANYQDLFEHFWDILNYCDSQGLRSNIRRLKADLKLLREIYHL